MVKSNDGLLDTVVSQWLCSCAAGSGRRPEREDRTNQGGGERETQPVKGLIYALRCQNAATEGSWYSPCGCHMCVGQGSKRTHNWREVGRGKIWGGRGREGQTSQHHWSTTTKTNVSSWMRQIKPFVFCFFVFFPNSLWCLYTDNTWRTLFYKYSFKHSPHVSHPSPPLQHNIIVSYESNPITQSVDMQLPTGYKKRLMQWSIVNRWRCWGYGSLNMQQGKPRLSRGAVHLPQSPVVWGHQVVGKKITNQCIFSMWLLLN